MGAGIGLGLGVNMGGIFGNAMSGALDNTGGIQMTPATAGVSSVGLTNDSKITCPNCNAITAKSKFCSACGSVLINSCRNCGAQLNTNAAFCSECGTKI